MNHLVDLGELQRVVGQYSKHYSVLVAAGPMTAAVLFKTIAGKNKLASGAVAVGTTWFAVQELASPMMRLIQDQFGYLNSVLGAFHT